MAKSELDLANMLDEILKSGARVAPDMRIDDRDMKEFPNFFSFAMSPKGMNQKPFARQLVVATHMLAEWCPRCSRKAFHNIKKIPVDFPAEDFIDRVSFLEYGVCPKCGARKSELYKSGELNVYSELVGCAGQRSGKSAMLSLIGPYLMHKWLKLQKPVEVLGLMRNSILMGTFVGLTYQKAVELLWQPILNAVLDSKWFQEYHSLLDHYGDMYGQEVYKLKDTFIQYNHRNLWFLPSGPNKRTLRGATRIIALIDELGWFPHGEENEQMERASANEVYISLDRSLKTVRESALKLLKQGYDNIPMAYQCSISSPSSYMDKIMSLLRTHMGSKEAYCYHLASWEMNPLYTKESFAKEYREDPIKAERDFGANPPMSENPWISEMGYVDEIMKSKSGALQYQYVSSTSKNGISQRYAKIINFRSPQPCPTTVLSVDAGHSNNSFAIAITHPVAKGQRLGAKVLAVAEVAPKKGENVINHTKLVREFIYKLIEAFNVGLVVGDRWQSIKTMTDIEDDMGIPTEIYSLVPDDFTLMKEMIEDEVKPMLELPKPEMDAKEIFSVDLDEYPHCFKYKPVSHLYHQFSTCTLDSRGVLQKGPGYTDDLLRAVCLGVAFCIDEDIVDDYNLLGTAKTTSSNAVGSKTAINNSSSNIGVKAGAGSGGLGISSSVGAKR